MLFNSVEYMLAFLPLTFIIYFVLNKYKLTDLSKKWLIASSLFFYAWWNPVYIFLLLGSVLFNFSIGTWINNILHGEKKGGKISPKMLMITGVACNLLVLGYFKYADFFISNANFVFSSQIELLHIMIPLAISFQTFQQIAYLIDSYRGETKHYSFTTYILFITFFPQLIAGPIVLHKEIIPQIENTRNKIFNYKNIAMGLFIFCIGLFKKVVIADTFSVWVGEGFDHAEVLTFFEAWVVSLSYTFQLYFDFSGYTDMAMGAALLFNIHLPLNFNSPYKATSIQDFWRRWHMTLSRFLREYIYIPLGGNRKGKFKTYVNIMITFLLGGLWHGASWTFVFWGFLHGIGLIINRIWDKLGFKMNSVLAWFITFNYVNIAWVFFRAEKWSDAVKVLKGMFGMNGVVLPEFLADKLSFLSDWGVIFGGILSELKKNPMVETTTIYVWLFGIWFIIWYRNSVEMKERFRPSFRAVLFTILMILACFCFMTMSESSEFLYFNF